MTLAINQIYQGDARELLSEIEPDSIACSVWSPPYHVGKDYERDSTYEEWVNLLHDVIKRHYALLKPGGFLVINLSVIGSCETCCFGKFFLRKPARQTRSTQPVPKTPKHIGLFYCPMLVHS